MSKYFTAYCLVTLFLLGVHGVGFAQSTTEEKSDFDPIKSQMSTLIEDNRELMARNKELNTQLISLQLQVHKMENQLQELDPHYVEYAPREHDHSDRDSDQASDIQLLEGDALIQEAQNLYLSGQFMDLPMEQKLKELYLYDLSYQKQELELDLWEKESIYQEIQEGKNQELTAIEEELKAYSVKGRDLMQKIAELEKAKMTYP